MRFLRVKFLTGVVLGIHLALLSLHSEAGVPLITTQPLSQSVAAGGTVTLTPAVNSTAPLGYQWWKDGSLLLGATSSSLIFTHAQVTNSGAYYLVATNASGTAVSLPALVQVGAPDLFAWGDNQSGALGNGSSTNVYAPLNTFSNVVSLAAGAGFTLFVDGRRNLWATGTNASGQLGLGSNLNITNRPAQILAGVPVAGVFSGATAIHTILVAPPAPPVITLQPTNQTLPPGATANFAVAAYGFAPLAFQWQFQTTNINNASAASFALPAIAATSAGAYQAVVSNPGGSVTSFAAALTVGALPEISSATLLTNHSVKLICTSNSLTISGRLIATTNLLAPLNNWLTLTNLPAGPVGPVQYIDSGISNFPSRFYCAVWP